MVYLDYINHYLHAISSLVTVAKYGRHRSIYMLNSKRTFVNKLIYRFLSLVHEKYYFINVQMTKLKETYLVELSDKDGSLIFILRKNC